MSYAMPADFVALFKQTWLSEYLGLGPGTAQDNFLAPQLEAASSAINAALAKGRYPSPLDSSNIAAPKLAGTLAHLTNMTCYLAVEPLLAGATDLPAGPKAVLAAAKSWLASVEAGTARIDGVERYAPEVTGQAAGNVLFIRDGYGEAFPAWQSTLARRFLW